MSIIILSTEGFALTVISFMVTNFRLSASVASRFAVMASLDVSLIVDGLGESSGGFITHIP